jgi:hypothetical protein
MPVARKYGIVLLTKLRSHGWVPSNVVEDILISGGELVRSTFFAYTMREGKEEQGSEGELKGTRNCKNH